MSDLNDEVADEPGEHSADSEVVDGDAAAPDSTGDVEAGSVEEMIATLEQTAAERDDYLDSLRRTQADFENFRKRVTKQAADDAARGAEQLVDKLLPVLDACDAAVHHGAGEVEPIYASLLGTLEREGLERIAPTEGEFDPNRHEAVMHEPAESDDEGTTVADLMRAGYAWKGRVLRPAMVKVRG